MERVFSNYQWFTNMVCFNGIINEGVRVLLYLICSTETLTIKMAPENQKTL